MKQIILTLVGICTALIAFSQNHYEFKRLHSNRKVSLSAGKEITLQMIDTINAERLTHIGALGHILSLTADSVVIDMHATYTNQIYSADSVTEEYIAYSFYNPQRYAKNQVDYITYIPKARPIIEMATFASVGSLLIVAPLYAFNFKTLTFNSNSYVSVAAPAAVVALITLPLYYKIEERKVTFIK